MFEAEKSKNSHEREKKREKKEWVKKRLR